MSNWKDYLNSADFDTADFDLLLGIEAQLQHMADLAGADVFIDCVGEKGCFVAAQARPTWEPSMYQSLVVGQAVTPEKEPAVFQVLETGLPARDIRATTQENKQVQQVVVPVKNPAGRILAVLIQEKDVSRRVRQEQKYRLLARASEERSERLSRQSGAASPYAPSVEGDALAMKEIHHRVKNNLQMVASILSMSARRTALPQVQAALEENVNRVLSFATIHDMLTHEGAGRLSLSRIIARICQNVGASTGCGLRGITITPKAEGDIAVDADTGTAIAMVLNELVTNAVKHAFTGRQAGAITVSLSPGNGFSTLTVADDGIGFAENTQDEGAHIGMRLVRTTVAEKLGGTLQVHSDEGGSRVRFDFRTPDAPGA